MPSKPLVLIVLGVVTIALLALWLFDLNQPQTPIDNELSVIDVLGGNEEEGFARAEAVRDFVFPVDHGPHPEFKTEWWYFTGNLFAHEGRRFGYQLTFFRSALTPLPSSRRSNWSANQIFMAHFAVTDPGNERFYFQERFSRAALGLAGAEALPLKVWLEDWSATSLDVSFPLRLVAETEHVAIELFLHQAKPIVLQGQNGLSQKSAEPGNASYYYSVTRLPTEGRIRIGNKTFKVSGNSWLDREWSTSVLGDDQVGWDWFSLQFNDGRELMYYQLRNKDGSVDPLSSGVLVREDGKTQYLRSTEIDIEIQDRWRSPITGATYPNAWTLAIPEKDILLNIAPVLKKQELNTTVRYWEGAVDVQGRQHGKVVTGYGYVELTGYD